MSQNAPFRSQVFLKAWIHSPGGALYLNGLCLNLGFALIGALGLSLAPAASWARPGDPLPPGPSPLPQASPVLPQVPVPQAPIPQASPVPQAPVPQAPVPPTASSPNSPLKPPSSLTPSTAPSPSPSPIIDPNAPVTNAPPPANPLQGKPKKKKKKGLIKAPPSTQAPPRYQCPGEVQALMPSLLRDLPSYLNRSYLKAKLTASQTGAPTWTYAQFTSLPEFEPLPTGSAETPETPDPSLSQSFFTVLERQYSNGGVNGAGQMSQWQNYHWLFLVRTTTGWQLALLYSRIGPYPSTPTQTLSPPRDSSQSATANAIKLWLRDCEAGVVGPKS